MRDELNLHQIWNHIWQKWEMEEVLNRSSASNWSQTAEQSLILNMHVLVQQVNLRAVISNNPHNQRRRPGSELWGASGSLFCVHGLSGFRWECV